MLDFVIIYLIVDGLKILAYFCYFVYAMNHNYNTILWDIFNGVLYHVFPWSISFEFNRSNLFIYFEKI